MNRNLPAVRFLLLFAFVLIPSAVVLSGCEDPFNLGDPVLALDSLRLAAPTSQVNIPTAVDINNGNALRRPEQPSESSAWDFQLRQNGSSFSLVPFGTLGRLRGAGIRPADAPFETAEEAPRGRSEYTRGSFAITPGQSYYVQTREAQNSFCVKYGILKVLSVSADSGTARLAIRSNQNCDDERLQP
jgi:hypothetical protein